MAQDDLFKPVIRPPATPAGRSEPRLWVRRLALFENPDTIIRDVSLKPGLNIIWTPDMSSNAERALAHGSGKSTFCRLLRGCIGEPEFASTEQRALISQHFRNGFVAAEVIVDGVCWVPVRFWGLGGHDFVAKAENIEQALARGRQEGDMASLDPIVSRTFFSALKGQAPDEIGDEHIWDVLRAWLTRDQDCRLSDILDWRSSKTRTGSRAQQLGAAGKLTMLRLALRAIDPKERNAAKKERNLIKAVEQEHNRAAAEEFQRKQDLAKLRQAFDVGEDVGLEDEIGQQGLVSLAYQALQEAMRISLPEVPDFKKLLDRHEELAASRIHFVEKKNACDIEASEKRVRAGHLRSEAEKGVFEIGLGNVRVCPICHVPLDEVLANGCKISLETCNTDKIQTEIAQKKNDATKLDQEVKGAESQAQTYSAQITRIDQELTRLAKERKKTEQLRDAASRVGEDIQNRVYQQRRLLDTAKELADDRREHKSATVAQKELEVIRAELELGRKRAQRAVADIEERYKGIISSWIPSGVDGKMTLDGNGLKVDARLSGRGEVSTAALESLKIVAFDLAALHMATEEKVVLPAFLVHDSPREADLDAVLYERLFEFVESWEVEGKPCCFQYIITTTTAPPPHLQTKEYVRLEMSSTPASTRLFKVDL